MSRTTRMLDERDIAEIMHKTNPIARFAFKQGNAAGAHVRDKNKDQRRQTKLEEKMANRGLYD